eukprot:741524_1
MINTNNYMAQRGKDMTGPMCKISIVTFQHVLICFDFVECAVWSVNSCLFFTLFFCVECESVCYNNQIFVCMIRFLCACIDSEKRSCVYFRNICVFFITIIVPLCYEFCMSLLCVCYVFVQRFLRCY